MKTTIIPAQIMTLEDTVTANLSLLQLVLLVLPVFTGAVIFGVMPPFMQLRLYKVVLLCAITLPSLVMAIRFKGEILLKWLILITVFKIRPDTYLLSKCDSSNCFCLEAVEASAEKLDDLKTTQANDLPQRLLPEEVNEVIRLLKDKSVSFVTDREGILHASFKSK